MKIKFTFALIAAMALLVSCNGTSEPPTSPTDDQIIEINGLKWATGNLVAVAGRTDQCKIGAPGDGGLYFQFGSLIGWSGGANGDGVGIGKPTLAINTKPSAYTGFTDYATCGYYSADDLFPATDIAVTGVGDPCRFYLGGAWRLPTTAEFRSMCRGYGGPNLVSANAAWTTSPVAGMNFNNSGTKLFVPASGYRNYSDGALYYMGVLGYYWSESVNGETNSYYLYFNHGGITPQGSNRRRLGFPVRCVAGEMPVVPTVSTEPTPPTADQIIEISGLKWTTGNLVAVNAANAKVGAPGDVGLYFQFGSLIGWSGGVWGNGVGVGEPALAVNAMPSAYTGSADYATCGYYSAGTSGGLPSTDDAATGIGDPCRFYLGGGWRLPTAEEYRVMCNNAANGATPASANAAWVTSPVAGMNFNKNSTELFIPASGRRTTDGSMVNVGLYGYCWSASVCDASLGCNLFFYSDGVSPQNSNSRRNGFPVRCVQ